MKYIAALIVSLCFVWIVPASAATPIVKTGHASAQLIVDGGPIKAGEPFFAAISLDLEPHWHIYWRNPGDSGLEATIQWQLPEGWSADAIHWPVPQAIPFSGLVNYGYEGNPVLLVPLTAPDTLSGDPITIAAKVDWLICKDICIPESAELSLDVTPRLINEGAAATITQAQSLLPRPYTGDAKYEITNGDVYLTLSIDPQSIDLSQLMKAHWFPIQDGIIANDAKQETKAITTDLLAFKIGAGSIPPAQGAPFDGVLMLTMRDGAQYALQVQAKWMTSATDTDSIQFAGLDLPNANKTVNTTITPPALQTDFTLWTALLFAFIGGMILNLMPCVLPILSLKILGIVKKAAHQPAAVKIQGISYTIGVLVSFGAIAGILIFLQQAGHQIGWGFQLQSPFFVAILIYVLWLVGLNLSGRFDLPNLFGNVGQARAAKDNISGSFFTGVLATLVATPCTAPFMATAIGFALGQSPVTAMLVFLSLGLGLAFPYLLISFVPPLHRLLPKPGAWMERFKHWMAIPIYLSVVWLLWVLAQQTDHVGLGATAAGLMLIFLTARRIGHAATAIKRWLWLLVTAFFVWLMLSVVASTHMALSSGEGAALAPEKTIHDTFYPAALEGFRIQKKPVFVYATAAWCITCKVNEKLVLSRESVQQFFADKGITVLVADWTNRNDMITQYLHSFGRDGVPLYAYYPPNGEPVLLPQLLTPELLRESIEQADQSHQ